MQEMTFAGQNLARMASKLIETFRSRQIDIPPGDDKLIGDLGRLPIVERSFGYKSDAVRDAEHGHADTAFALAIALPAALDIATRRPLNARRDPVSGLIIW